MAWGEARIRGKSKVKMRPRNHRKKRVAYGPLMEGVMMYKDNRGNVSNR